MTVEEKAAEIERLQRYIRKREGHARYAESLEVCRAALAAVEGIEPE